MTEPSPAELPLEIDRVHGSRSAAGEIRLALGGRWRGGGDGHAQEPLLVVQIEGRRHRFAPEHNQPHSDLGDGRWSATYSLPDWAEPRHEGQAAVWLGSDVIPVPPLGSGSRVVLPPRAEPPPVASPPHAEPARVVSPPRAEPARVSEPAPLGIPEASRSGPLAGVLLKDTVAALHTELEQRTAEAAHLRGTLADTQAELEARAGTQAQLETALAELGVECKRLMAALEDQRPQAAELAAMRRELAAAQVARDAAVSEATGLQAQLSRVGAELAVTRERVNSESGDLGEANRLLADARALAERLRGDRGNA